MERPLDIKRARGLYHTQKHNAARRGIGWELTFQQWLDWWGEDIERRGLRVGQLQMQRIADAGPYALGNIKKGESRHNAATRSAVYRNAQCAARAEELQAAIDSSETREADDEDFEPIDPEDLPIREYYAAGHTPRAVFRAKRSDAKVGKIR